MSESFQAQNAARAKALRAKFERLEEKENRANANAADASHAVGNLNGSLDFDQSSEHTTKSLRARFESLKNESQQPKERMPRPKVNRFVVSTVVFIQCAVLLRCRCKILTYSVYVVLAFELILPITHLEARGITSITNVIKICSAIMKSL
jgi:hypothetical protein